MYAHIYLYVCILMHDWLTIRNNHVSYCIIFIYEQLFLSSPTLKAHNQGHMWHWKEAEFVFGTGFEAFLLSLGLMTQSYLLCSTLKNALFVNACLTLLSWAQGSTPFGGIPICLIDSLMQSLYCLAWVALVLMTPVGGPHRGIQELSTQIT